MVELRALVLSFKIHGFVQWPLAQKYSDHTNEKRIAAVSGEIEFG